MANRVLVVGWDGADWDVLDPLLAAGELPALRDLQERGRRGVTRSCLPSHSWAAWPTFLTGRDPGGHGVFDILEYAPGETRRPPVSWRSILAPTWPERLTERGKSTLLVNVPLTYPPPPIRGVVISGGVVPPRTTFTHPADVGVRLGWPINRGSWTTFRDRPLDLVADLEGLTRQRAAAMRTLLDEEAWDVACLVFVSTDRAQHCLLEYVHPGHPAYPEAAASPVADRVRDLYRLLDRELESLLARVDDDDTVIFMSDHGHHPCTRAVSMNKVLERLGFLRFAPG
jgi:predicted AlkP superfamily phosphohydrolase/phosphomutase